MKIRIWGCRGSCAAPGPETLRYGGNTSCVEVTLGDGTTVILDAGTGIRPLGLHLAKQSPPEVHILLSHLHLDHLQGLGFFSPLFMPACAVHLWGPRSPLDSLGERIAKYLSPPLFPVRLSELPAQIHLHDVEEEPWAIGPAVVRADPVTHAGPTVGYRIEEDGHSLAYLPDHEPSLGINLDSIDPEWMSGFRIAQGVDVLLHDAQYSNEEYPQRIGWGHSSIDHVVTFAQRTGAERLVLFHHDPLHSDDELEALEAHARRMWGPFGTSPALAFEGMEMELTPHRVSEASARR